MKSLVRYLFYCLFVFVVFFFWIDLSFSFTGWLWLFQIILIILFLLLFAIFSFGYFTDQWGEKGIFFIFLLLIINLFFIWLTIKNLYVFPLAFSLLGFIVSALGLKKPRKERGIEKETKKFEEKRYLASQLAKYYHQPECEWAKKIRPKRRTWFSSEKEAEEAGFKKHSCLE